MTNTQTPLSEPCEVTRAGDQTPGSAAPARPAEERRGTPSAGPTNEVSGPSLNTSVPGEVVSGPLTSMPEEQAAWIRANVWTQPMRKSYRETPGFYLACSCQAGLTHGCENGHHTTCHRATPLRDYHTVICGRSGEDPRYFRDRYQHQTDVSATGPRRVSLAMVWLSDRVCRWICPCPCGHPKPAAVPVQEELFAGVGT